MKLANKDKMKTADMEKTLDAAEGSLTSILLEGTLYASDCAVMLYQQITSQNKNYQLP